MRPLDEARKTLGEGPSFSRRDQQLARLLRASARPPSRSPRARLALAGTLMLLCTGLIVGLWRSSGAPARPMSGMRLDGAVTPALDFLDGSSVALDPSSTARIDVVDERQVELTIERGSLTAHVQKGTGRIWRHHAGPWLVIVRGTRLRIGYSPEQGQLEVGVSEGAVEVSGPGGSARVEAGETLQRRVDVHAGPTSPAPPRQAPQPTELERPRPTRHRPAPVAVEADRPVSWLELLAQGHRAAALDEAERQGVFSRLAELDESVLLQLADAARLERRVPLARALLAESLERGQAGAAEAAYLLGRLDANDGRPEAARASFSRALSLSPHGPFAEQSRGRLLEVLLELEELPAAREAAADYLQNHPTGAWAGLAKKLAGASPP